MTTPTEKQAPEDVEKMSFEEALEELEALTASMAAGEATLRESVDAYARGTALLERCRRELDEARATIERLRPSAAERDGWKETN